MVFLESSTSFCFVMVLVLLLGGLLVLVGGCLNFEDIARRTPANETVILSDLFTPHIFQMECG